MTRNTTQEKNNREVTMGSNLSVLIFFKLKEKLRVESLIASIRSLSENTFQF